MNSLIRKIFLVCLIVKVAFSKPEKPQKYAILLATTKSWIFYRHQSTILHAYDTLTANGVPKQNIITMFYDDIADNPKNPEQGVIRNHPSGPNLYKNVTKDYIGKNVSAKNFLAVLTGEQNKTRGPVLKSGPKDTIFIYICGIGTYRSITFPHGPSLPADKFIDALKQIRSQKRARKIYVMLDVAYAASLVHGIVPRRDKIFVSTATHFKELPWAVYCYVAKKICYSTLYGASWTQHSDRLRRMKFGRRETLFDQFNAIRTLTVYSHVNIYGEIEMGQSRLKEFLDYKQEKQPHAENNSPNLISELSETILLEIEDKMEGNMDEEPGEQYNSFYKYFDEYKEKDPVLTITEEESDLNPIHEIDILPVFINADEDETAKTNLLAKREFVKNTFKSILQKLNVDFDSLKEPSAILSSEVIQNYERSIEAFSSMCIDVNENTYALQFLSKLAKICEMQIPLEKQYAAMRSVCFEEHRRMTFAH